MDPISLLSGGSSLLGAGAALSAPTPSNATSPQTSFFDTGAFNVGAPGGVLGQFLGAAVPIVAIGVLAWALTR